MHLFLHPHTSWTRQRREEEEEMPSPSSFIILFNGCALYEWTGNGGVTYCPTTHKPIVLGTWSNVVWQGRKKGKRWRMSPPLTSQVYVPSRWRTKVFQEQQSPSNLALKAAGLKKQWGSSFGVRAFLYGEIPQSLNCSTTHGFIFQRKPIWGTDRQMSHSVKSCWFTAGQGDRASNCHFHAHAKLVANDGRGVYNGERRNTFRERH